MSGTLASGQYFFSEVVSQGVLVHDSRRFTLATPKALTARQRRELAEHGFRYCAATFTA